MEKLHLFTWEWFFGFLSVMTAVFVILMSVRKDKKDMIIENEGIKNRVGAVEKEVAEIRSTTKACMDHQSRKYDGMRSEIANMNDTLNRKIDNITNHLITSNKK